MSCCNSTIIQIRQGDDSNFNDNCITFHINSEDCLYGWKARFELQDLVWEFDDITDFTVELIITKEQSAKLEPGTSFGYLKLIDNHGCEGTVLAQEFLISKKVVR